MLGLLGNVAPCPEKGAEMVAIILMWIDVPLTFVFGYGGASLVKRISDCKNVMLVLLAGLVLAGSYTFTGGIIRDWIVLRVSISAFAQDCVWCWISLELGGIIYLLTHGCLVSKRQADKEPLRRCLITTKKWMISHPGVDKSFALLETWGVYKFILAAVDRAIALGETCPFLQTLSGFVTGTLGGFASNVFVRRGHIHEIIREKQRYYCSAALLSLGHVFLRRYCAVYSEWTPLIMATVWLELAQGVCWVLFALDCRLNIGRGRAFRIKIGLELTVGAVFHMILRPGKGLRIISLIPNSMGKAADSFIVAEAA